MPDESFLIIKRKLMVLEIDKKEVKKRQDVKMDEKNIYFIWLKDPEGNINKIEVEIIFLSKVFVFNRTELKQNKTASEPLKAMIEKVTDHG